MSPQMTAVYARLHNTTLRRHWENAVKINAEAEPVVLPNGHHLADAEWMKISMVRAKVTLPNGYCGAPIQTDSEFANPCLDCHFFLTIRDFLDQHRRQRDETHRLIGDAEHQGLTRLVERNTPHAGQARPHHRGPGADRARASRRRRKGGRPRCHRLTTPASSSRPPSSAATTLALAQALVDAERSGKRPTVVGIAAAAGVSRSWLNALFACPRRAAEQSCRHDPGGAGPRRARGHGDRFLLGTPESRAHGRGICPALLAGQAQRDQSFHPLQKSEDR
ncbi:hypothetical protein GCM10010404_57060 [Nonomuraea africana]